MALTAAQQQAFRIALANRTKADNILSQLGFIDPDTGVMEISGTIIGAKDNATSMRIKGAQHSSEGGAQVQNYMGIFNNASYDTVGTLKTRASFGGNIEMDVAIQSPHALLLIAQDGSQTDGVIKACSQTGIEFHAQYSAEELSPKRLIVNRVSSAAKGSSNTSDVTLATNAGKLYLQYGSVDGGVVLPAYTNAQRDALTPAAGEIIHNSETNLLNWYNGSAWVAIDNSAV